MDNAVKNNDSKLWSFPYIVILLATFASNITMTMMMPILPIYIKTMGKDSAFSGLAVGIFTFAALFCRPVFGRLLDIYSKKAVLIIGSVVIAVSCLCYRFVGAVSILLVLRVVHGIGYGASTNATGTVAADLVPSARRSEGIGYYGVVFAGSLALGPALSMLIFNGFDINTVFFVAFGIATFGCVASLICPEAQKAGETKKAKGASLTSIIEKTALPACSLMVIIAFAYSAVVSFLASYSFSLGLGSISIFFLCYAATLLLTRIFVGKYTDKHGVYSVLIPGIVSMAAAFLILAIAKSIGMFVLAAVFYGIGYGSVQPTLNVIVISQCDFKRRGAANATFFGAMDLGIGLGAVVWGLFSGRFGYPMMYGCCIILMAAACVCYFCILRKK